VSGAILPLRWDVFCKVVDNYGDIGVCWRLARQLAREHGLNVRLWVDDLLTFARLESSLDAGLDVQFLGTVEVRRWPAAFVSPAGPLAGVIIEAFACGLPESLQQQMAEQACAPVWINLEYLSAERWVDDCHGLGSPQPGLPLTRHFFFPGFRPASGGVLVESGLLARRDAFRADQNACATFWQQLGLPAPGPGELRVSMFAYPGAPLTELLQAWAGGTVPVTVLLPEGLLPAETAAFEPAGRGALRIQRFPFLPHADYDRLLWACDVNFVRGEDSFVRGIWAGRPLVWQIYPQDEAAHFAKLDAFLDLYQSGLERAAAQAQRRLWDAWNSRVDAPGVAEACSELLAHWPVLAQQAGQRALEWGENVDLASKLIGFVGRLASPSGAPGP